MPIHALILIGYIVATVAVQRYMLRHPPANESRYVHPVARNLHVILTLGIPLISPLIAYLWIGPSTLHPLVIVTLSMLLPVCLLFLPWMYIKARVQTHPFFIAPMLVIILLALGGILYQMLIVEGGAGFNFTLLPLAFFMLAPPALLLGVLYYWGPRVLPLDPSQLQRNDYDQAAQLLTGFFSTGPRPAVMAVDGALETRIKGSPFVGTGPGLLITGPEYAVVLYQGPKAKTVIGPGVFFTGNSEVPRYVMDLRGHFRTDKRVLAQTRDNIEVLAPCASVFKIRGSMPPDEPQDLQPWRYDADAALQIYLNAEVNPERKSSPLEAHEILPWTEIPLQEARHHLRHLIKRYSLDELYAITEPLPGELPRLAIAREVKQWLIRQMARIGIEIVTCGVGNRFIPADPKVVAQRIENWKAHQLRTLESNRSKVMEEYVREQSRARSEVLRELLQNILEQFNKFQAAGEAARRSFIALQLLTTLDAIAQQPEVKDSLPPPTREILAALQQRAAQEQD